MSSRAKDGTPAVLEGLLTLAVPLLRKAQQDTPTRDRRPPGRVPTYADWQIAVMILPGLLKKRKSKNGVYRQMLANRDLLRKLLNLRRLPARSTFMERYARVWPLAQQAIALQGRVAVREKVARPRQVSVDKSIIKAKGPVWHQKFRRQGVKPPLRGLDVEAGWGRSATRGWLWGYSYEVAVCAGADAAVAFPLVASADTAEACEMTTCRAKVAQLPAATRTLCADAGYDSNDLAELFEGDRPTRRRRGRGRGRRRGPPRRHFLCPPHRRAEKNCPLSDRRRERQRQRRLKRIAYFDGRQGQRLYRRRKETVEPFNANYKGLFELSDHVWHRGLNNNRTQLLLTIFIDQLLLRYHHKTGHRDAQVQYLLDGL